MPFFWLLLIFSLFHSFLAIWVCMFLAIWVCMFWCDFVFILLCDTNFLGLYFSTNLENIWPVFLQISLCSNLYFLPLMIQLYIFWLFDLFHRSLRLHPLFFFWVFVFCFCFDSSCALSSSHCFFLQCQTYLVINFILYVVFFSSIMYIWFFLDSISLLDSLFDLSIYLCFSFNPRIYL